MMIKIINKLGIFYTKLIYMCSGHAARAQIQNELKLEKHTISTGTLTLHTHSNIENGSTYTRKFMMTITENVEEVHTHAY